ncbi:MAG: MarR family transcriptional regulator [Gemmatimonadetes bacterium]|nr:MarR family transcriptional regulator [Gemmatimonadota bacterium]
MKLNQKARDFVGRMGITLEGLGASPTFGRLFAFLLLADRPVSLEEMAEELHVSKASVSTNIRLSEQMGLVQRVTVLRDRRHFYEILPDSFERALQVRLSFLHEMVALVEQGLGVIEDENQTARERLEGMREFYEFVGDGLTDNLRDWAEYKSRARARDKEE